MPPIEARWLERLLKPKMSCLLTTDQEVLDLALDGRCGRVQTINLHHLALAKHTPRFREAVEGATWVTADGWPVRMAFAALGARADRVTGYDFVANLIRDGRTRARRLGLLGASPETGAAFGELAGGHGQHLVFRDHRARDEWDARTIAGELAAREVDILLVAVTPPHGDIIAHDLMAAGYGGLVVSVGGAVEIATGGQSPGPRVVERLGLVWLYRLLREPRRLASRYLIDCVPVMLTDVLPLLIRGSIGRRLPT